MARETIGLLTIGGDQDLPYYSSDMGAAMQVENRIAELGLKFQYVRELSLIVSDLATNEGRLVHHFDWIHATAEQRCRAALAAV